MDSFPPQEGHTLAHKAWKLVQASRLPAWMFGPILFSIGMIHSGVIPASTSRLMHAGVQVLALSFPLCIIVFGVNDVYDYDSDKRNPRKAVSNGLEGGILHKDYHAEVLKAAYVSTVLILGCALLNWRRNNIVATASLVLLGWQYSSPPLRLKEVPGLDSLSNGCIVFLAWFCGFSFSGLGLSDVPTKGFVLSLCTTGIHALGAVMDTEADESSGQSTIAIAFGKRPAAIFAAICYLFAMTLVGLRSLVGVYLFSGLVIMMVPCFNVDWAHRSFQAIVYHSVTSAVLWIIARGWSTINWFHFVHSQ